MLCTPPAFILSQDQTLKLFVFLPLSRLDPSFELLYLSFFYFLELCYSLFFDRSVFRTCFFALYLSLLLFNCQGSIPLPSFAESLSIISLSNPFVNTFSEISSKIFCADFLLISAPLRDSLNILSLFPYFVKLF